MTQLVTLTEIADRSGIGLDALRTRRARGTLGLHPVDTIAGAYVYAKDDAERWLKKNKDA